MSWAYAGSDPGIALFSAALAAGAPMAFAPGMRVLEVGCCESSWLELAAEAWPNVSFVGIDQRKHQRKKSGPVEIVIADALKADTFDEASFDAVVSLSAIEHFGLGHYGDPKSADGDTTILANIWRWLKPGGWVYFDVPYDPIGYRVQGTKCRVYDDAAKSDRLVASVPVGTAAIDGVAATVLGWVEARQPFYAHANSAALIPKPAESAQPFYYVAMTWKKPQ